MLARRQLCAVVALMAAPVTFLVLAFWIGIVAQLLGADANTWTGWTLLVFVVTFPVIVLRAAIRARKPEPRHGTRSRRLRRMVSKELRSPTLDTHVRI